MRRPWPSRGFSIIRKMIRDIKLLSDKFIVDQGFQILMRSTF